MVKETYVPLLSSSKLGLISFNSKFYDLLEASPDASEADLKKAYRKKVCGEYNSVSFYADCVAGSRASPGTSCSCYDVGPSIMNSALP